MHYSSVYGESDQDAGFLEVNPNLMNVAVSRAKDAFVMFCAPRRARDSKEVMRTYFQFAQAMAEGDSERKTQEAQEAREMQKDAMLVAELPVAVDNPGAVAETAERMQESAQVVSVEERSIPVSDASANTEEDEGNHGGQNPTVVSAPAVQTGPVAAAVAPAGPSTPPAQSAVQADGKVALTRLLQPLHDEGLLDKSMTAQKANPILAAKGLIIHTEQGYWIPTDYGRKLGVEARSNERGATWPVYPPELGMLVLGMLL